MNTEFLRNKRVLVSGGTGFVGSRVVPLLLEAGAEVTLLCRASSKTDQYPASVRAVRCDLARGNEVREALGQCDIFVHMAALLFGLGWQDYLKSNCGVAQNIAKALQELGEEGPKRVVFVSSLAAAGPCDDPCGKKEDEPARPVSAYGWSKLLSENILRAAAGDRLVVVRPPIIYGSGDKGLLPVYQGLKKGLAALPGLGRSFPVSVIHVDDVARAVVLACQEKAHGTYHLSDGQVWPMADFYAAAAKALGCRAKMLHLPLWFMGLAAAASSALGSLLALLAPNRRAPNWNIDKFRESCQAGWVASNRRIVEELGFAPTRDLESGMAETMAGYKARNIL